MSEKISVLPDKGFSMKSAANQILRKIRAKGRGWVFVPRDFLGYGSRAAVDQCLSRLARNGVIRRIDRGFYDYPRLHAALGKLAPDTDSLAKAISDKTGNGAFPSGARLANYLGLSTQVPAKPTYLTNGPSRVKKIAGRTIAFKHARVPILDKVPLQVNYMIQALSHLGKANVDLDMIKFCANRLNRDAKRALSKCHAKVPGWMSDGIRTIQSENYG